MAKKKGGDSDAEIKTAITLLKKEARLLGKSVRKRGTGSVSVNTLSLIEELVTSIRVDRNALKFSQAKIKEESFPWPFPKMIFTLD